MVSTDGSLTFRVKRFANFPCLKLTVEKTAVQGLGI